MSDNFFYKDENGINASEYFHCTITRYPELAEAFKKHTKVCVNIGSGSSTTWANSVANRVKSHYLQDHRCDINFVGFLDEDDSMAAYELILHNNIKNADLKNLLKKGD